MSSRFAWCLALLSTVVLTACDDKKDNPITGTRELVFMGEDAIKADQKLSGEKIRLPRARASKSWPVASGNVAHAKDPVATNPVKDLRLVWKHSIGAGAGDSSRLLNGPIAAQGKVFTIDTQGLVTAFDLKTGGRVWSVQATTTNTAPAFSGGLAYDSGYIFAVTPSADVVMLEASSGKILKRFPLTAPVRAAPTVQGGYIYLVNINNQLEVIDYRSGQPAWSHSGIIEIAGLLGGASPAMTRDVVVVPYTSGEVYALHALSGMPLWSESLVSFTTLDPVSSLFHVKARPVIKGQYVYIIGNGGLMRCLDINTGRPVWTRQVGGIRSPAVSGQYLFMVTNDSDLVCFDRHTGGVYWTRKLPQSKEASNPILWAGPILVNNSLVMAGSNGRALIVSAKDGSTQRTLKLDERTLLSPIVADGTVIFLNEEGELIAYR